MGVERDNDEPRQSTEVGQGAQEEVSTPEAGPEVAKPAATPPEPETSSVFPPELVEEAMRRLLAEAEVQPAESEAQWRTRLAERELEEMRLRLEERRIVRQEEEARSIREAERRRAEIEEKRFRAEQEAQQEARRRETWTQQRLEMLKARWTIERIRGLVSLLLVSEFLVTTLIVIYLTAAGITPSDLLQTVSSFYSSITGAIYGILLRQTTRVIATRVGDVNFRAFIQKVAYTPLN